MSEALDSRLKRLENVIYAGKEDSFLMAWGRLMTFAAQSRWTVMFLGLALLGSVGGNVALILRWNKRDMLVFMKDEQGNVVPVATMAQMTAGSLERDDNEIKGFARRWVADAFTYNPLNIKDNVTRVLRQVDASSQNSVKFQLHMEERALHRDNGISVQILDEPEKGKGPAISILRREPLEVSVVFQRIGVNQSGEARELSPMVCNLQLRLVPRSSFNPNGFLVSDMTSTKN